MERTNTVPKLEKCLAKSAVDKKKRGSQRGLGQRAEPWRGKTRKSASNETENASYGLRYPALMCSSGNKVGLRETFVFFFFAVPLSQRRWKNSGGRGWWQGPNPKPHSNRKHKRYKNPNRDRTQNQPVRDVTSGHQPNNKGPA